MIRSLCITLLLIFIPLVELLTYEKPVAEKLWRQRCIRNSLVLNDCNWCWCNSNFRYSCNARVCKEVDQFGHFNDAIRDIDVGMEGHGVWRSTATVCEPGVHYSRGDLLCVCTEDGAWPSPVCRDTFQVLHPVMVINHFQLSKNQECMPTKLYLADCNVCFCPSTGRIDPSLCTQMVCTKRNLISTRSVETEVDEVYAECAMDQKYKLGCKNCICLRNNRLLCDNCTNESECDGRAAGETFTMDCNTCRCDADGSIYCTFNRCLHSHEEIEILKYSFTKPRSRPSNELDCEPGTRFMKDCNTCYCFQTRDKISKYGCTLKKCHQDDPTRDCEIGDTFRKDCQICHCGVFNGLKMEICQANPQCSKKYRQLLLKGPKRSYNQDCEPLQEYKDGCNTCTCSIDGKSLSCTDNPCETKSKPISINIIPVALKMPSCPKGHSYKIDCNYCLCLENGNAICTTMDCQAVNK